jgi:hypothetical protein
MREARCSRCYDIEGGLDGVFLILSYLSWRWNHCFDTCRCNQDMDKLYNVDKKGDREVPGQNGPCNLTFDS